MHFSRVISAVRVLWRICVGATTPDQELATEPAPLGPTLVIASVATAAFVAAMQFDGLIVGVPSAWWIAAIGISTYLVGNISQIGMGHGLSTDASGTLASAGVLAFGPHPMLVLAAVAGKFMSDLRVPQLTAGRTGAIYNASSTITGLVAMGFVVEMLRGRIDFIVVCVIGALVGAAVNVVTIAPALLGWRGTCDLRQLSRLASVILLPVSEMLTELITVTAAAVIVASVPWAAILLVHGPVIAMWSNIRRQHELAVAHKRVTTDVLTGLPNRRGFEDWAREQLAPLDGLDEHACASMILDLDNFKRVNDIHGHAVGDDVLCLAACVLEGVSRDVGRNVYAARFGGEEFVVMGVGDSVDTFAALAERIRLEINERIASWGCSASIGVAYPLPGEVGVEAMIQRADEAMYVAKMSGKNRVVVQGDPRWVFNEAVERASLDVMELRTDLALEEFMRLKQDAEGQPAWQALPGVWASVVDAELACGHYRRSLDHCYEMLRTVDQKYAAQRGRVALAGSLAAIRLGLTSEAVKLAAYIESISERSWPDVTAVIHVVHGGIIHSYGEVRELTEFLTLLPHGMAHTPWSTSMFARLSLATGVMSSIVEEDAARPGAHPLHQLYCEEVQVIKDVLAGAEIQRIDHVIDAWRVAGRRFDVDQLRMCRDQYIQRSRGAVSDSRAA